MTPREFFIFIEGYSWREDQAWLKLAWQTAHIINHWRKEQDQVTIENLLPKRESPENKKMTDEQMAERALEWAISMGAEDRRKGAV